MLKPVSLSCDWSGPVPALTAFDPLTAATLGMNCPGVYLHVTRLGNSSIIASYVGKHTMSVVDRQWEHFVNYTDGKYHLYDASGARVFVACTNKPANFIGMLENHILLTEMYFGRITNMPVGGSVDPWVGGAESLLQRSPTWKSLGGTILNYRQEPPVYQMHDRYEVTHHGAHEPLRLFGNATIWDRRSKTVTSS